MFSIQMHNSPAKHLKTLEVINVLNDHLVIHYGRQSYNPKLTVSHKERETVLNLQLKVLIGPLMYETFVVL
jgi:hypothetical protein